MIIVSVPKKKTFTYHHGSEKFPNYQKYNTNADNTTNHSKNYQQDIWTFGAIWNKTQKYYVVDKLSPSISSRNDGWWGIYGAEKIVIF